MNFCIKELNIDNFKLIYNDMIDQFPKNELKSYDHFIDLIKNGNYKIYGVYDREMLISYFASIIVENFLWIDYIAVFSKFQCLGFGLKILKSLPKKFENIKGCIFEIEKPNIKIKNTIRRMKFYTKAGAKKINCNYYYPHKFGLMEMDLYYFPFNHSYHIKPCDVFNVVKKVFNTVHTDLEHKDKALEKLKIKD